MAEEKIIRVQIDNSITVTNTEQSPNQTVTLAKTQAQTLDSVTSKAKSGASMAKSLAIQYGKQTAQYALSNYGNLTGDYVTQENISAGIGFASNIAATIANPILGGISMLFGLGTQIASYHIDRAKKDKQTSYLRERTQTNYVRR